MDARSDPRRDLPSIDAVLRHADVASLLGSFSLEVVTGLARRAVVRVRERATSDLIWDGDHLSRREWLLGETVGATLAAAAEIGTGGPCRVINATGVVLHTNLGRAPLATDAAMAIARVGAGYADVELDLGTGERGSRHAHLAGPILDALAATHPTLDVSGLDAIAVNNCAGAILLVLAELARGRDVIVSRGHLVEIGGGFRVPDIMRQGGSRLVEVGTTNRTRLGDYADAVTSETAAILTVHPSNFRITGFTESVAMTDLAALGLARGVPVVDDIGSGCLLDTAAFGIGGTLREPRPSESLAAGASVVTFSGDKLLGGPQAGIIVGRAELVSRIRRHPLARALRLDKLGMVALAATLAHYRRGEAARSIPIWQMIGASQESLTARAETWARDLERANVPCDVAAGVSAVGGGSMPGVTVPTTVVRIGGHVSADTLAKRLRQSLAPSVPIVGRIEDGMVTLDPRTVAPSDDVLVAPGIVTAVLGRREPQPRRRH
jgi:L-seryl-tRNA(Ser) seleniumtransferase